MRKIGANYIFPVSSPPIKNGIVVFDDNNVVVEIIDNNGKFIEQAGTEFYNGILIPGLIIAINSSDKNKIIQNKTCLTNIYEKGVSVIVFLHNRQLAALNKDSFKILDNDSLAVLQGTLLELKMEELLYNPFKTIVNYSISKNEGLITKIIPEITGIAAKKTGINEQFGCFEVGKTGGACLLENVDLINLKFKSESTLKRIV